MKKPLVLILLLICNLFSYSQDTLRYYETDQSIITNAEPTTFIKEIITHENYYSMSYFNMEEVETYYCEFKSIDPIFLDGLARYYYEPGIIYSVGKYHNGKLLGKWMYYDENGKIDTVTYQSIDSYIKIMGCNFDKQNIKNASKTISQKVQESVSIFIRDNFHLPGRIRSAYRYITLNISMVIDADGKAKCVEILNFKDEDLLTEVYRILSMYKSNIEIENAFQISVFYNQQEATPSKNDIFFTVDKMPEFPGGDNGLRTYIAKSVIYPKEAQDRGIMGQVYVSFVVDPNGKVQDAQIENGINYYLDQEALRIVRAMPLWTPGSLNGKPVKVSYTIPINFSLR